MDLGGNHLPRNTLRRDRPASSLGIQHESVEKAGSMPSTKSVAHLASLFDTMIERQRCAAPMPEKQSTTKESVTDRLAKMTAAPSSPKDRTEIPDGRKENKESKVSSLIANFNKVYSSQVTIGGNACFSPGSVRSTHKSGKDVRKSCPSFRTHIGPVELDFSGKGAEHEAHTSTASKIYNLSPTRETVETASKEITGKGNLDRFRIMDGKTKGLIADPYCTTSEIAGGLVKPSSQAIDSKKKSKEEFLGENNSAKRIPTYQPIAKSEYLDQTPSLLQNPKKCQNSFDEKPLLSGRCSVIYTQTMESNDKSVCQKNASTAKEISIEKSFKKSVDQNVKIMIIEQNPGIEKDVTSKKTPSLVKDVVSKFESNFRQSCMRQNVPEKSKQISPRFMNKDNDFFNRHFKKSETNLSGITNDLKKEKCKSEGDLLREKPFHSENSSIERDSVVSIDKVQSDQDLLFSCDKSLRGKDMQTSKTSRNKVKELIMKLEGKSKVTHKCSTGVQNTKSVLSKPTNISNEMIKENVSKNNDPTEKVLMKSNPDNKNGVSEEMKDFSRSLMDETSGTNGSGQNDKYSKDTTTDPVGNEKIGGNVCLSVQEFISNEHDLSQIDEKSNKAVPNTFLISEIKSNKVSKEIDEQNNLNGHEPEENKRQIVDTPNVTNNIRPKPYGDPLGCSLPKSAQNERQDCSVTTALNNLRINDQHFYEEISPKSEKISLSNKAINRENIFKPSEDMSKFVYKETKKDREYQDFEIIDNLRETSDKTTNAYEYQYTKLNSLYSECLSPQCIQSDKCCCRQYAVLNNSNLSEDNVYEEISDFESNPPTKSGNNENIMKSTEIMSTCNARETNDEIYEPIEHFENLLNKEDAANSENTTDTGSFMDNPSILQTNDKESQTILHSLSFDIFPNKSEQITEDFYEEILPGREEMSCSGNAEHIDDVFGEFENEEENGSISTLITLADQVASEKASLLSKNCEIDSDNQSKSQVSMHYPLELHAEIEAKNTALCKVFGSRLSKIYEECECSDDDSPCMAEGNNVSRHLGDETLDQKCINSVQEELFQSEEIEENIYEEVANLPEPIRRVQSRSKLTEIVQEKEGVRTLWSQIPEVVNSGLFEWLSPNERRIQETKFEIIASEASYAKSLDVLLSHFMASKSLKDENVLNRGDKRVLFGDIQSVKKCSEEFLEDLGRCWSNDVFLSNIDEIIRNHAKNNFGPYIGYCSKQVYQANMLKKLMKSDTFFKAITKLQSDKICQNQGLYSFLILPMQRITRIPLLIQTIIALLPKSDEKLDSWKEALFHMNDVVDRCNEGARKATRIQETVSLNKKLDFKDVGMFPLLTGSRWIELKGELQHYSLYSGALGISSTSKFNPSAHKISMSRKPSKETLSLFLFTDLLLIAKKHSEDRFLVVDYCQRNLVRVLDEEEEDLQILFQKNNPESNKHFFVISLQQNCEKRNVKMVLSTTSEDEKAKWLQAFPGVTEEPVVTEDCYMSDDGPYLSAICTYAARSEIELSLEIADILKVTNKEGEWCYGIRVKDGKKGWFPENYCIEVESKHEHGPYSENLTQQEGEPHYNTEEEEKKYPPMDAKTEKKKLKFKTGSTVQSYKTAIKKSVKLMSQPMSPMGFQPVV